MGRLVYFSGSVGKIEFLNYGRMKIQFNFH